MDALTRLGAIQKQREVEAEAELANSTPGDEEAQLRISGSWAVSPLTR